MNPLTNLETYKSFKGRVGRQTFWLGTLVLMVVQWVVMMVVGAIFGTPMPAEPMEPGSVGFSMGYDLGATGGILAFVILLPVIWASLAIAVKRWHDRNKSGWWILIGLVPVIGFIWYLVECGFLRGTEGPNRFGEDPLAG